MNHMSLLVIYFFCSFNLIAIKGDFDLGKLGENVSLVVTAPAKSTRG